MSSTQVFLPAFNVISAFSNFAGVQVAKNRWLHPRVQLVLGVLVGCTALYSASFIQSYLLFKLVFLCIYASGVGFVYTSSLYYPWKFFPGKEGVVTGVVIAGFGIGGFMFTELSSFWINPNGVEPRQVSDTDSLDKLYPHDVADNLPRMLRLIAGVCAGCGLICLLLIQLPDKDPVEKATERAALIDTSTS